MKKHLVGMLIVVAVLLLAVIPVAVAQDMCVGDFDYDTDCDGTDAAKFVADFGRGGYVDPCPLNGPAPVPKTGQTMSYATGDDGDLQKGVQWPYPRFTDNGDGTILDKLTGLMWLKNANCFGIRSWDLALSDSNGLENGECGLTDGSNAGDWRLPNKRELISITHDECYNPAVPNTTGTGCGSQGDPFNNIQASGYWSSTTFALSMGDAWYVYMVFGSVDGDVKFNDFYVWPVRGGQ